MKEATGELNMTVVTVVAIAAVGTFFYVFIWPGIQAGLMKNTCSNICPVPETGQSVKVTKNNDNTYTCTCNDAGGTVITIDKDGTEV